jgi:exodeoxyribonuclease V alpha subunit
MNTLFHYYDKTRIPDPVSNPGLTKIKPKQQPKFTRDPMTIDINLIKSYFSNHLTINNKDSENIKKDKRNYGHIINTYAYINTTNKTQLSIDFDWLCKVNGLTDLNSWKLFRHWLHNIENNELTPTEIENNPIKLKDFLKKGFNFIDKLALGNNWWNQSDFHRKEAYIVNEFYENVNTTGDIYIEGTDIYKIATIDNISINRDIFIKIIRKLIKENTLVNLKINGSRVFVLAEYYQIENEIYTNLSDIMKTPNKVNFDYSVDDKLSTEQKDAVIGCITNKLSIINGPPGTGKTSYVLNELCKILRTNNKKILVLAPTHAAKKTAEKELMNGVTYDDKQIKFETLQSVIFQYKDQKGNYKCNLTEYRDWYDYFIIDEMSMVDSKNFNKFLTDVSPSDGSVVLIGDYNQLPPISAGNPFKDMILSEKIPVFKLTKNHRSRNSDIPNLLEKINTDFSTLTNKKVKSYILSPKFKNVHEHFGNSYLDGVTKLLYKLKKDGYRLFDGVNIDKTVQILCPINKTILKSGIVQKVREIFYNKKSDELYEVDDIIILKKNTICFKNGDYAKIVDITPSKITIELINNKFKNQSEIEKIRNELKRKSSDIEVDSDGNIKLYPDYLNPSYAITVHKSQGLGFDKVICIYEGWFASKNLNYTAFSRAKEDLYLFGEQSAYRNNDTSIRKTLLNNFFKKS